MKIIIPVLGFGRAGGERVLSRLATELISCGHDVIFIAPDNNTEPYYSTAAKVIRSNVSKSRFKLFRIISLYYNLWRKCVEVKPDVAIASFHLIAYVVALLPIKRNKKIYYVQAYEVNFPDKKFAKLLAYLTYRLPLKKILNSPGLLPHEIDDAIGIVPAGLDLDVFSARSVCREQNSQYNIGLIGRKEKHKGTSEIVRVLCGLEKKTGIIINIAVYLDDRDRECLIDAGFEVNFVPIHSDTELAYFYQSNDIMIAVGLVEDGAFHYPCAESMACGCLVISNYAPLTQTNSVLKLQTFDAIKLSEAINLSLIISEEDKSNEIQENIAALKKYDWKIVGETFNFLLLRESK